MILESRKKNGALGLRKNQLHDRRGIQVDQFAGQGLLFFVSSHLRQYLRGGATLDPE
jgi:hypothetical protein